MGKWSRGLAESKMGRRRPTGVLAPGLAQR